MARSTVSMARDDRLHQRIVDAAGDATDPSAFLERVLDVLAERIDQIAGYVACTDPVTTIFSTAIVLRGYDPALCGPVLRNEFMVDDVNKFVDLQRSRSGATTLARATHGRLAISPRHREVNAPAGHDHELRAVFALDGACWGVLHLVRGPGDEDFTDDELAFVDRIGPSVAAGIRAAVVGGPPAPVGEHVTPAVVLLSEDLVVTSMTERAAELVAELGHRVVETETGPPLPGEAFVVAARARARADGVDGPDPVARVRSPRGGWLTVRGECTRTDGGAVDSVALVIEPARTSEVVPLFVAAHGLTDRERDVLAELADGRSTNEIADVLFISPHTVRDHVKSLFAKVGVSSRGELISELYRLHHEPGLDVRHTG